MENRTSGKTNNWDYTSDRLTLLLTQPLYRRQNWVDYDQSKLSVAQAEAAFAEAQQSLILRTAQAYFDVLQARANLEAAKAYKASVSSQLDVAQGAFKLGTGINTDVHDAEARYATATTQVIAAETDLNIRLQALEVVSGPLTNRISDKLENPKLKTPDPLDLQSWVKAAEQGNLQVQQQQLAAEISRRELEKQRAGHLPTLDLVLSSSRNSTLNSGSREVTDDNYVGLQFNFPIYAGGAVTSRTSEAAANHRAALAALDTSRRAAVLETHQAYLGVVNGLSQVRSAREGLAAARQAVMSNKDAFDLGVRLNIDVLNAQNQVFVAERDLNQLTVNTLLSQLRLKAVVGTLSENDVVAVDHLMVVQAD